MYYDGEWNKNWEEKYEISLNFYKDMYKYDEINLEEREKLELDEFVFDMHTSEGKKRGKSKEDFKREGCFVLNENEKYLRKDWKNFYVNFVGKPAERKDGGNGRLNKKELKEREKRERMELKEREKRERMEKKEKEKMERMELKEKEKMERMELKETEKRERMELKEKEKRERMELKEIEKRERMELKEIEKRERMELKEREKRERMEKKKNGKKKSGEEKKKKDELNLWKIGNCWNWMKVK